MDTQNIFPKKSEDNKMEWKTHENCQEKKKRSNIIKIKEDKL